VTVWNKKTEKVIKGCCAPTEDKLEEFLAGYPAQVYDGQELTMKSPTSVPDKAIMADVTKGALANLRKEAASSLGVSLEELDEHLRVLEEDALQSAYATIVISAHEAYLLPIWVLTPSLFDANVFVVGDGGVDGGPPPIRICQVGRDKFIPLFDEPPSGASTADASTANAQAVEPSAAAQPVDVEDVPQFKTELKTMLRELYRFLVEVAQDRQQDVPGSAAETRPSWTSWTSTSRSRRRRADRTHRVGGGA
jgi:hypothetical protein